MPEFDAYQIRKLFSQVITEAVNLSKNVNLSSSNKFFFRNNIELNKKINKLLESLFSGIKTGIINGMSVNWDLALEESEELFMELFGDELENLPKDFVDKNLRQNEAARQAFFTRRVNGLTLSDRVWKLTRQFKQELELALEVGILKGQSASQIATSLKQYLNEPDKLFRRVRNENGELRLSQAAKSYNPGQGVYRSSYKNALRLARNEINFSYEHAQKVKRQQQTFVVGIEIRVSPNHNPEDDKGGISCLSLQGKYPKDFDFTYKWHVNCKCQSYAILKTKEEIRQDMQKILQGNEPSTKSKNEIKKIPKKYTNYLKANKKKKSLTFDNNR